MVELVDLMLELPAGTIAHATYTDGKGVPDDFKIDPVSGKQNIGEA